jgi:MFS family permease
MLANLTDGMDIMIMSYVATALAAEWRISAGTLGLIFSAGIIGMIVGAFAIAPMADRLGRRPVILGCFCLAAIGTLGATLAHDVATLCLFRIVAGVGIGATLPISSAFAAEMAPAGRGGVWIGIAQAGYPLGAILTGGAVALSINLVGWRGCLFGAFIVTATMVPICAIWLPESLRFRQVSGSMSAMRGKARLAGLFDGPLRMATPLLWIAVFFTFGTLYFILSWLPRLMSLSGLPPALAIIAGSVYNVGAIVGTLLLPRIALRRSLSRSIAAFLLGGAILLAGFAIVSVPFALRLALAAGLGFLLQGGFNGFYGLAVRLYPPEMRGTGLGLAIGFGRIGSMVAPLCAGLILDRNIPIATLFQGFALCLGLAALLTMLIRAPQAGSGH